MDKAPSLHTQMEFFHSQMCDFSRCKLDPNYWLSPWFYTSPTGYKMCIAIDANGSGVDNHGASVTGKYLSAYVHLMPGKHDDFLWWPFCGEVEIALQNRDSSKKNYSRNICFTEEVTQKTERFGDRVFGRDMSEYGWGHPSFIAHKDLDEYLDNDCLRFIVEARLK